MLFAQRKYRKIKKKYKSMYNFGRIIGDSSLQSTCLSVDSHEFIYTWLYVE